MTNTPSILDRISAAMRVEQFFAPAELAEVERVERELGVPFPEWLREIYAAADGFVGPTGVRYLYRLGVADEVLDFTLFLRQEWSHADWLERAIVFADNGLGGSTTVQWAVLDGQLIEWCYGDGTEYRVLDIDMFEVWAREQRRWNAIEAEPREPEGWQLAPEHEYVAYLEHERHMFAWCLVTYGDRTQAAAETEALEFFRYEPAECETRGLVFHDEAWHWAMLQLYDSGYWQTRPDRAQASESYRAEARRFDESRASRGPEVET